MLQKIKNRKSEGFTIIEVLIVLAIAGLILLIVFLAVPQLQRNARNTGRKSDASRLSTAISDFTGNNNGTLPGTASWATDCSTLLNDGGTLGQLSDVNCGSNSASATGLKFNITTGAISLTDSIKKNAVMLDEQAVCGANGATTAGSTRQVALLYKVETSSGPWTWSCIQAQ